MKLAKSAIVVSAMIAGATAFTSATAAPVVYGKANVSYQLEDDGSDSAYEVRSNASRLGLKGSVKLPNGGQAIYQAEFEISIDDGDKSGEVFSQRNIFAGLVGELGTVKIGHFDTLLKAGQGKVDLFNDLSVGDIKGVIRGENRGSNTLQFESPAIVDGAVKVKVALFSGEVKAGQDGPGDGVAASVSYQADNLTAILSFSDGDIKGTTIDESQTFLRAAVQYQFDSGLKLGVLAQTVDLGATDGTQYVVSAAVPLAENYTFKAQYVGSDMEVMSGTADAQYNVGVDYKVSKKVKTYAYYGAQDNADGTDASSTFGLGMQIKF